MLVMILAITPSILVSPIDNVVNNIGDSILGLSLDEPIDLDVSIVGMQILKASRFATTL